MAQTEKQLSNVDNYGYPLPPNTYKRVRKIGIRASKVILLKCIYLVMSLLGVLLWLGRLGKKYAALTPQSFHPRRILVLRLDLIGDLVLSLTVVRALKRTYPQAEIDLLAIPSSAPVVLHDPNLAQVIPYDP